MTTNARRIGWMTIALVIVGVASGVWFLTRQRAPGPAAGQTTGAMKDMPGMPGMNMPVAGSGSIQLSAAQIQQFGITFGVAERRLLTGEVRTTGVVAVDETRVVEIAPRFGIEIRLPPHD